MCFHVVKTETRHSSLVIYNGTWIFEGLKFSLSSQYHFSNKDVLLREAHEFFVMSRNENQGDNEIM